MTVSDLRFTDLPPRLARLPRSRGFPVPWFVAEVPDGQGGWVYDFRVVDERKLVLGHEQCRCFVCGEPLEGDMAFVIGPMCGVNRVSSEPPSHRECSEWSARICPFLSRPDMRRRTNDLPEGHQDAVGIGIERNPGVTLVWITKSYEREPVGAGHLFYLGAPVEVVAYREGRPATTEEISDSVASGLPLLMRAAALEGAGAVHDLGAMLAQACNVLGLDQRRVLERCLLLQAQAKLERKQQALTGAPL